MDTSHFFENIFNTAQANAIMIMSVDGIISKINEAFTNAYGYTSEDLHSKHFRLLYIEKDQVTQRPEIELNTTLRQGSSGDENYLVHKDGSAIWVTGESILVKAGDKHCIVKIIHNIHAQKQLERYLLSSNDVLDSLFESVKKGLLLLDATMRTIKANAAFRNLFQLDTLVLEGSKIQDIKHSFWQDDELKNDIRNAIVHGQRIDKEYIAGDDKSNFRKLHVVSKLIVADTSSERKLLLVIQDV